MEETVRSVKLHSGFANRLYSKAEEAWNFSKFQGLYKRKGSEFLQVPETLGGEAQNFFLSPRTYMEGEHGIFANPTAYMVYEGENLKFFLCPKA